MPGMAMGSAGFGALPGTRSRGGGSATGWFIGAAVLLALGLYWNGPIRTGRVQAAALRNWASSSALTAAKSAAINTSGSRRKSAVAAQKTALLKAYKTALTKVSGSAGVADSVPDAAWSALNNALIKRPASAPQAVLNTAARLESSAVPVPPLAAALAPALRDDDGFRYISLGLFGACGALALVGGGIFLLPFLARPRAMTPAVAPAVVPAAVPMAPAPAVPLPRAAPPVAATPFPPPPEGNTPMVPAPRIGGIAAGVAAVASSSSEVARLVKRLEELENLSEKMRDERDEKAKELTWTQSALDDFKRRVADATTMAAAAAAQSAGASEQRAAQAEQKVTEAVEHINEALQRAVGAEHGVHLAREKASSAEERASMAESKTQEMQYQLARAMERLADLERLAATARIGGLPNSTIAVSSPLVPPALPVPDAEMYRNGVHNNASTMEEMLAAAAVTKPQAAEEATTETIPTAMNVESAPPIVPMPRTQQRTPPPRLTNTKMSDIEAGLKLARSIRTRTQKAAADLVDNKDDETGS